MKKRKKVKAKLLTDKEIRAMAYELDSYALELRSCIWRASVSKTSIEAVEALKEASDQLAMLNEDFATLMMRLDNPHVR